MNSVAKDVTDPETGMSVWKRWQSAVISRGDAKTKAEARGGRADLRIGALGSGSDYTPFIQHLGVPTLNMGFGGEGGGVEHAAPVGDGRARRRGERGLEQGTAGKVLVWTALAQIR